MRLFSTVFAAVTGTGLLVACAKSGSEAAAEAGATTIASAAAPAAPPASAPNPSPVPPAGNMTIPERFNAEAAHRPTGVLRVEDVTAAFRKAGVTLEEEKQHLASFYKAAYCVGAKAKGEEISFSVCEYTDAAAAKAGKELNDKAFSPIKNRASYVNGATTLTVLETIKNPDNDVIAKKLVDTFASLKSPAK
jgi:hypothetical protein